MADRLKTIKLSEIIPADDNLRTDFTGIEDLAASIAFIGLLEPPRVQQDGDTFKLIAGERRYRALQYLVKQKADGFTKDMEVKVVVGNKLDDAQRNAAFLIENMQRVDLSVKEQVEGIRRLVQEHGMTQAEVASNLGVSKQWVSDRVAMITLPEHVFDGSSGPWHSLKVEDLAALGRLPEKEMIKMTKDGKVPPQHTIHEKATKLKRQADGAKKLAQMQKDGYLAVTAKDLKRIVKAELADLDGLDQMVKLKLGNVTAISRDYMAPKEPSIRLRQEFESGWLDKVGKNDIVVLESSGEFRKAELVAPKGVTVNDDGEYEPDEYDLIDERNEQRRQEYKAACRQAERNFLTDTKTAALIAHVLMHQAQTSRHKEVLDLLGLPYQEPDLPEDTDAIDYAKRNEALRAARDVNDATLNEYASKNNANLARAAMAVLLAQPGLGQRINIDIDYPVEPEYEEYPEDDEDAA